MSFPSSSIKYPTKKLARPLKHEWLSRKLWFSVFSVVMLYQGMVIAIANPAFFTIYSTFVGGVVGIAGLFLAGNVIAGKLGVAAAPAAKPENSTTSEETPG